MSVVKIQQTGNFKTYYAEKYIRQLCKHFAHKVTVHYDAKQGRADLPPGPAHMIATQDNLEITLHAKHEKGLEVARYIIDSHLKTFAFRDNYETMDWDAPCPESKNSREG